MIGARYVLRRIANLKTGTVGLLIHTEKTWPLKLDRGQYSFAQGRAVRLRDRKRRHIKKSIIH